MTRIASSSSAVAIAAALVALSVRAAAQDAPPPAESNPLNFRIPLVGEMAFSLTSTSVLRYVGDHYAKAYHYDDFFGAGYQRFDLALTGERLRIDARIDSFVPVFEDSHVVGPDGMHHFTNPNVFSRQCDPGTEEACTIFADVVRLERIAGHYTDGDLSLEFGDVYTVFGRGMALTFRKSDLLGLDNAIRGGRAAYNGAHFTFQAVAGLANPQNIDPKTYALLRDPNDAVVGVEAVGRVGDNDDLELGFAGSNITFQDALDINDTGNTRRSAGVLGWHLAAPALLDGKLALYAEVDALRHQFADAMGRPGQTFGRAVYASAQLQLTELTVLAEWVDYSNYLLAPAYDSFHPSRVYSSVPTLELDGFLDVRDIFNRRGGSVKVDYAFLPGPWSVSANTLVVGLPRNELSPIDDPWQGVLATHAWLGLHKRSESDFSLDVTGGYRREFQLANDVLGGIHTGDFNREALHGKIDVGFAVGEHSFEIGTDQRWDRHVERSELISRGGVSLTYSWGIQLTLTATLRWDNFKAADVRAMHEFYPSFEAKWTFSAGNFVSAFVGATPGGILCAGGVCREVPLFEGGMVQLVLRL